jgi:hypothetical protein
VEPVVDLWRRRLLVCTRVLLARLSWQLLGNPPDQTSEKQSEQASTDWSRSKRLGAHDSAHQDSAQRSLQLCRSLAL